MVAKLRSHVRHNAVGYLALFVALGGTSYAAVAVTGRDIVDDTVTTTDVKDASLLPRDFKGGSLPLAGAAARRTGRTVLRAASHTSMVAPSPSAPGFGGGSTLQSEPRVAVTCRRGEVVTGGAATVESSPENPQQGRFGNAADRPIAGRRGVPVGWETPAFTRQIWSDTPPHSETRTVYVVCARR